MCLYMEKGDYGQDCASFTLVKDATQKGGGAIHNKDIIKLYTYYDKFLADGTNGSYSEKTKQNYTS